MMNKEPFEACKNVVLFLAHLEFQKNCSSATVSAYRIDLREFEIFLRERGKALRSWKMCTRKIFRNFLFFYTSRKYIKVPWRENFPVCGHFTVSCCKKIRSEKPHARRAEP